MSDMRKFCWGTFIGLSGASALVNHDIIEIRSDVGVIAMGLSLGCLAVIIFGSRAPSQETTP